MPPVRGRDRVCRVHRLHGPAHSDAKRMEVVGDCFAVRESGGVPRSLEPALRVRDVHELTEASRPVVEVLLVAELAVLDSGGAPFDAAVLRPPADWDAPLAVYRQELDAVPPAGRGLVVIRCVGVFGDLHDCAARLEDFEDGARVRDEPHVHVDVGDALSGGIPLKHDVVREGS